MLLVAGLLVGVAALAGAATPADGGARGGVLVAAFLAVLPGLVALIVGLRRPTAGLLLTAAAGWWGLARLLADLSLVSDAATVVRPELFAETSARSQPFAVASGTWLLLLADVGWIGAGVLATRAVAPACCPTDRPVARCSATPTPSTPTDWPTTRPRTAPRGTVGPGGRCRW